MIYKDHKDELLTFFPSTISFISYLLQKKSKLFFTLVDVKINIKVLLLNFKSKSIAN